MVKMTPNLKNQLFYFEIAFEGTTSDFRRNVRPTQIMKCINELSTIANMRLLRFSVKFSLIQNSKQSNIIQSVNNFISPSFRSVFCLTISPASISEL
jgi:hypothetical protein